MRFSCGAENGPSGRRLENELKQIQQEELKSRLLVVSLKLVPFRRHQRWRSDKPRYLMERYQNRGSGQGVPGPSLEKRREKSRRRAQRQVQATLLVEKISQLENIEVSDKEVQERVENLTRVAGDRQKRYARLTRPDTRDDLRAQMVFDRTLGFLLEPRLLRRSMRPPQRLMNKAKG